MVSRNMVRRAGSAVVGLIGLGVLSGCGAGGTPGFEPSSAGNGYSLSSIGNLIAFNKLFPDAAPLPQTDVTVECPTIDVQDGTSSVRFYSGKGQANENVRYGFSLGDIARECSKSGDKLLLKVGAEGRVLLGPEGSPGSFTVPIRIAVRNDATQKVVYSQLYKVGASVAPGSTESPFTYVTETFSVPFVRHPDEDYVVLVGFDQSGKADTPSDASTLHRKRRH